MNKRILFMLILIFASAMLSALGNKEKDAPPLVQVTGIVRLTGTALFPELVIANSENMWVIAKEEADKLHDMQYRTVTVEAEETVTELFFANGRSAGIKRELRNIKVINVE